MPSFVIKKRVNVPIEQVWASWDDFANIDVFNPNITESHLLPGSEGPTNVGTKRHCSMPGGKNYVRESITAYEPMKRIELEIFETNMPIKKMVIDTTFKALSNTATEITQTTDFEPKMGILGKLMGPMMKKQFQPIMAKLLDGNADYLEKGVIVERSA